MLATLIQLRCSCGFLTIITSNFVRGYYKFDCFAVGENKQQKCEALQFTIAMDEVHRLIIKNQTIKEYIAAPQLVMCPANDGIINSKFKNPALRGDTLIAKIKRIKIKAPKERHILFLLIFTEICFQHIKILFSQN